MRKGEEIIYIKVFNQVCEKFNSFVPKTKKLYQKCNFISKQGLCIYLSYTFSPHKRVTKNLSCSLNYDYSQHLSDRFEFDVRKKNTLQSNNNNNNKIA